MFDLMLYPEDTIVLVTGRDRSVNTTTGALDDDALTAATGTAYLSLSRDGAALAGTTLTLTESSAGGTYYGTWTQATITAALAGVPDGSVVWRVVSFTGAAPVKTPLPWLTERT